MFGRGMRSQTQELLQFLPVVINIVSLFLIADDQQSIPKRSLDHVHPFRVN